MTDGSRVSPVIWLNTRRSTPALNDFETPELHDLPTPASDSV